ncbi:hypothetical protein Tco_0609995 [Tanacetum coccineum]
MIDDGDRLTSCIQHEHGRFRELMHTRALEPARDLEHQDGPVDAGSSFMLYISLKCRQREPEVPLPPPPPLMTDAAIRGLITQGVADALVEQEAHRSTENGNGSHNSRNGGRRTERTTRECTYKDFLNCQPLKFKGTEGVLALMCGRMFLEESDEVKKYVGGLPDMIRGNMMSCRPKTMQEAIEFANDQIEQKLARGIMSPGLTLLGLVKGKSMEDLYLSAPSATTITMVRVHLSATIARRLAIWPVIVKA